MHKGGPYIAVAVGGRDVPDDDGDGGGRGDNDDDGVGGVTIDDRDGCDRRSLRAPHHRWPREDHPRKVCA